MTEHLPEIETPSGKNSKTENFPIGSWLLAPKIRNHVAIFYAVARATDDIADNPDLDPNDKIERLDGFTKTLTSSGNNDPRFRKADELRDSLTSTGVPVDHCMDLINAFKQDAVKLRYHNWDELIGYCNLSAAPVGRYLLDLHGESDTLYTAADALCNSLQVINHLQDCKDDYIELDRVYLPQDWMLESGANIKMLKGSKSPPELRQVINRCLDAVETLLVTAIDLPPGIQNRRFAMETAGVVNIAKKLNQMLRCRDPLAERVKLTKIQYAVCGIVGASKVFLSRRQHSKTPIHHDNSNISGDRNEDIAPVRVIPGIRQ